MLGNLLIERVAAYKAYTNMQGYDLVAVDAGIGTSARIQVKSRWQTGASGFFLERVEADFIVFCQLNRGSRDGRREVKAPAFYIFPVEVICNSTQPEGKVRLARIPNVEQYRDR